VAVDLQGKGNPAGKPPFYISGTYRPALKKKKTPALVETAEREAEKKVGHMKQKVPQGKTAKGAYFSAAKGKKSAESSKQGKPSD